MVLPPILKVRSAADRILVPELMDEDDLSREVLRPVLEALGLMHRLSRTGSFLWSRIKRWAKAEGVAQFRFLDLACGDGAILAEVIRLARRAGLEASGIGIDRNETIVQLARDRHAEMEGIEFRTAEVESCELPRDCNVIFTTLFLHHLHDAEAARFLENVNRSAAKLVLIYDLRRSPFGTALASIVPRIVSRSHIVAVDGVRSAHAAFTTEEARGLADSAGIQNAKIEKVWPSRFVLEWVKG